jgi:hypothetical protein
MNARLPLTIGLWLALNAVTAIAAGGDGCGCDNTCSCSHSAGWCHHLFHKHCGCCQQSQRGYAREMPPAGPVVETVPMRVMPMMAAPMMLTATRAAYVEEPRSRESSCESSSSRLTQLEDRFNVLNERVNALQATIVAQTDILTQIKTKLDTIKP